MVKLRIRQGQSRKETNLVLMNSTVHVNDKDWTEIDDTEYKLSCINPNFFEVEGEQEKPKIAESVNSFSKDKPKKFK